VIAFWSYSAGLEQLFDLVSGAGFEYPAFSAGTHFPMIRA
jgi:hypothetical protein